MKKLAIILVFSAFFMQYSYSQDTLKHITSLCLGNIIKSETDSCPEGINFMYIEDTLEIYGTIWANCCGEHFVRIFRSEDTVYITTFDTGRLCNCICRYCFDIKLPDAAKDTFVSINEVVYNPRKIYSIEPAGINESLIDIFPNPAENILNFRVSAKFKINRIEITDLTGRVVKTVGNMNSAIDINSLETGTYFIKFYLDNKLSVTKIIIKK